MRFQRLSGTTAKLHEPPNRAVLCKLGVAGVWTLYTVGGVI